MTLAAAIHFVTRARLHVIFMPALVSAVAAAPLGLRLDAAFFVMVTLFAARGTGQIS